MHERPKPKSKIGAVWRLEFGVWRWLPRSTSLKALLNGSFGAAPKERQTLNPKRQTHVFL
jgi:hypothetical protein